MGLSIFSSNDMLSLKNTIGKGIKRQINTIDTFKPIFIVTQTEGMNVWLKTKLAEQLDIAANIVFLTPNDLVTRVNKIIGGSNYETLPKESISWALFELLASEDFLNKYGTDPAVSYYKTENDPEKSFDDAKRYALAAQLSDLFDQYQMYRHEMIQDWTHMENDNPCFQEFLWRALKNKLGDKLQDKTIARYNIIQCFDNKDILKWNLIKEEFIELHFFGLSIFTPFHFEIFEKLASIEDFNLNFYLLNPSPEEYWYEDKPEKTISKWALKYPNKVTTEGNGLLTNWGKVIQDTFYLFFKNDENINNYSSDLVPISNQKLLGKLQSDILSNSIDKSKIFTDADLSDRSLQIHSSYNKAREVEALYNRILNVFENDKTMTSKDIVVTCDIDEYASYISAVFDTAPKKFKYTIADSVYLQGDSSLKALESLLSINNSNINAETILQLLDFTCIKKKFGIQNTELVCLIVEKALFRFGIEGDQIDDSYLYSLSNSIKKIILGISLKIEGTYDGLYPIDIIEGFDSEEALRFCVFADALVEMLKNRGSAPRSLLEWTNYVDDLSQQFLFVDNEEDEKELRHQSMIVKQLGNLFLVSDPAYCAEEIPWNIFVNSFLDQLGKDRRTKRYVSNGITFCSHIPMRSLPYKMVCMLGLDFDKFPRKDTKLSFSKISGTERGDRSVRENDKHLFLENLMSAKDYFYLSYIGNSSKDNTNIPSSVLVEELIAYIADRAEGNDVAKKLITRHPLHAFSTKYNKLETPNLVSYLIDNQFQNIPMKTSDDDEGVSSGKDSDVIKLEDLISFFKNPIKYYYNKVLKIYYENQDTQIKVTELFEMDKLDEWKLKDLFMSLDDMDSLDSRDLIIKGELPSKNMGIAYSEYFRNKISGLHYDYWTLRNAALNDEGAVEYKEYKNNLNLDPHTIIEGSLDNLFNNQLLGYSLSSNPRSRKNLIELYIQYLFLKALDVNVKATFLKINSSSKKVEKYPVVNHLTSEQALTYLIELVSIFKDGQKRIISFYPDLVLTINNDLLEENLFNQKLDTNLEKLLNDIEDYFDDNKFDKYALNEESKGFFDIEKMKEFYKNIQILFGNISKVFNTKSIFNN